jgi:hypothetical protein
MPVDIACKAMLMSVWNCCNTWTVFSREVPGALASGGRGGSWVAAGLIRAKE